MKYPGVVMKGRKARGEVISIALANDGQHQDTGAKMIHAADETTSNIVSKSISVGTGRATYRGLVHVPRHLKGCKNNTECDALLINAHSRTDTYPAISVRGQGNACQHEASVSQISEEQIFYMQQRGISEAAAMSLAVNGFVNDLVQQFPMEYSVELKRLIDSRWRDRSMNNWRTRLTNNAVPPASNLAGPPPPGLIFPQPVHVSKETEQNWPAWFQEQQASAWADYEATAVPTRKDEAWRFSNIGALGLSEFEIAGPVTSEGRLINNSQGVAEFSAKLVFGNNALLHQDVERLPQGVLLKSLEAALGRSCFEGSSATGRTRLAQVRGTAQGAPFHRRAPLRPEKCGGRSAGGDFPLGRRRKLFNLPAHADCLWRE
jgi:hypothetical protein